MLAGSRIAVVLPAYNAARTLARTVAEIDRAIVDDLILTDDASIDATVPLSQALGLHTIVHRENRGYGANQKTCYAAALARGADIVVMLHPDYQYSPDLSFSLPLAVWNLTTFFKQMPDELEQAAMIDGCSPAQAFRKIILPLAAPGIFTTAIIVFIGAWNEFLVAVTMINDPEMEPATVLLSKFTGASQFNSPFGSQMAAGVIMTVPLVIMVLVFQRRIVAGLAAGGIK